MKSNLIRIALPGLASAALLAGCGGGSTDASQAQATQAGTDAVTTAGHATVQSVAGGQRHAMATRHLNPRAQASNGARWLARMPAGQTLSLAVLLSLRDEAGLDAFLADIANPDSPNYRHYLSVSEFTARFAPTQADHDALVAELQAKGLTVTSTAANRMVIDVTGKVSDIEQAFHVQLGNYQHPTESRTFFAPDREPTLDGATPVWRVAGLDNFSKPHPLSTRKTAAMAKPDAGTGPGGQYTGTDIRKAYYGGSALTGAGQSVALLQFGPYWSGDLNQYFANTGFSNKVPVNNILLDGTSMCSAACDDTEQVLDIAQAIGVAPGLSQVRVYIGNSDVDIFNRMATDNISKTISVSWGWGPADPGSDDPIFKQMAAQGQTIFVASGDGGAYTSSSDYPSEDVNVTAVGGTDLATTSGGAWSSETAWVDSGGGYVGSQPIPSWQKAAINASNRGSSTLRNVPDVAAEGNFDNYACGNGSCGGGWGGTSFASPRWAAYAALANQQAAAAGRPTLGFLNPTLYALGGGASYHSVFHDITSGTNNGFSAVAGYDLVTGWGSPNGQAMIDALAGPATTGITSGATYVLVNPNSNKALDVYSSATADGSLVDLWDQNGTGAQKWTITSNGDGTYTLVNPNSNKALDVYHSSTADGGVVDIWDKNGTGAQKWKFVSNGDGTYTLVNPESNKALDVYGASTADKATIDIWDINGTVAQKWKLVPAS